MTHLHSSRRTCHLVNLDPAAAPDSFEYAPSIDIKDLISVDDAMNELGYGPNGGLVYCFEYVSASSTGATPEQSRPSVVCQRTCRYLLQNMDWLEEQVGEYEDDYLIIDCPGTSEVRVSARSFFSGSSLWRVVHAWTLGSIFFFSDATHVFLQVR
jgi:GPN-loop GTPase